MTSFNDREKNFERKFMQEEELAFKANARRNKLLGQWAAAKLGKTGAEADQYAMDVVESDFESSGSDDVVGKLIKDFTHANLPISAQEIHAEMERLLPIAREQIEGR